jgi:hypothetical protein
VERQHTAAEEMEHRKKTNKELGLKEQAAQIIHNANVTRGVYSAA